jgi:DNA polymerase (family 10)
MDNYSIADHFSLLAKLMDIHGENSFKSKSYSVAAFNIEKLPLALADTPREKLAGLKGIGDSVSKKIIELLDTGQLQTLNDYLARTPSGVTEMLNIKGLGPKKINTIWKEMGIESIGELLYACNENRLTLFKGFGEKTQKNVQEAIEFYLQNQGIYLYAQIEPLATSILKKLQDRFPEHQTETTGAFRRQSETIEAVEYCTTIPAADIILFFNNNGFGLQEQTDRFIIFKDAENITLKFYTAAAEMFFYTLFSTSCSEEFFTEWKKISNWSDEAQFESEAAIFTQSGVPYIIPAMREKAAVIEKAKQGKLSPVITTADVRAVIHSHSNWSDGVSSIEEMAKELIKRGFEYLVISDHSKSAFYANGLTEERIRAQHRYIDELNAQLHPFKIFKSIECDILNDGSLDYSNDILSTFDLVIASVHSNLKMTAEKAMSRLLTALSNPYVTILGHMTGRLLLSRQGYPVDHTTIIDACAANKVVIELNAHPRRLDIDWRWIELATDKGVLISIDPDAHAIEGFDDIRYGVLAAQKAGLTREQNLSSYSLKQFEAYLQSRKEVKGL